MFLQKMLLTQQDIDLVLKTTPEEVYQSSDKRFSRLKCIYLGRLGLFFILLGIALMALFAALSYVTGSQPIGFLCSYAASSISLVIGAAVSMLAYLDSV